MAHEQPRLIRRSRKLCQSGSEGVSQPVRRPYAFAVTFCEAREKKRTLSPPHFLRITLTAMLRCSLIFGSFESFLRRWTADDRLEGRGLRSFCGHPRLNATT